MVRSELGFMPDEWDAMHWDERSYWLGGLAQVVQVKYGGEPRAAADSSSASTVDEGPTGLELFQALGGQVRTEEVIAE